MEIIKSNDEISRIFKEGHRVGTPDITLIMMRNEKQHGQGGRAAFVAGKRLGNAVWRNRAKRRMRAVYNEVAPLFESYNVIFLAKKSVNETCYSQLVENIERAMKRNQ